MERGGVVGVARSFPGVLPVLGFIAVGKALGKGAGESPPREQESGNRDESERNRKLVADAPCERGRDELGWSYLRLVDNVEVIALCVGVV